MKFVRKTRTLTITLLMTLRNPVVPLVSFGISWPLNILYYLILFSFLSFYLISFYLFTYIFFSIVLNSFIWLFFPYYLMSYFTSLLYISWYALSYIIWYVHFLLFFFFWFSSLVQRSLPRISLVSPVVSVLSVPALKGILNRNSTRSCNRVTYT